MLYEGAGMTVWRFTAWAVTRMDFLADFCCRGAARSVIGLVTTARQCKCIVIVSRDVACSVASYFINASHPSTLYSNTRGYTASTFLSFATAPPMNGTDAQLAHATAVGITIHRTTGFRTNKNRTAAT